MQPSSGSESDHRKSSSSKRKQSEDSYQQAVIEAKKRKVSCGCSYSHNSASTKFNHNKQNQLAQHTHTAIWYNDNDHESLSWQQIDFTETISPSEDIKLLFCTLHVVTLCSHYLLTRVQHGMTWNELQCKPIEPCQSELGLAQQDQVG